MIRLKNSVPNVYSNASRDFQLLCHLFDIVLNDTKSKSDDLYYLPSGIDNQRVTEILASTLGFTLKRNYDKDQLAALISILPALMRLKGTKRAVDLVGNALIKSSGLTGKGNFICELNGDYELTAYIPSEISDTTLFRDLLPYILPAGVSCKFLRNTTIAQPIQTKIDYESVLMRVVENDTQVSNIAAPNVGEAIRFTNSRYIISPDDPTAAPETATGGIVNAALSDMEFVVGAIYDKDYGKTYIDVYPQKNLTPEEDPDESYS